MSSLNHSCPWLLIVRPFCVLSAPFVCQITRKTSQETQQAFDWFFSILNFSRVDFCFFYCWFISNLHLTQVLSTSSSFRLPENSVCTCLSGAHCKINTFKSKKLRPLEVLTVERQICCKYGQCGKMSRSSAFLIGEKTVKTNRHVIYLSFCVIFDSNLEAH